MFTIGRFFQIVAPGGAICTSGGRRLSLTHTPDRRLIRNTPPEPRGRETAAPSYFDHLPGKIFGTAVAGADPNETRQLIQNEEKDERNKLTFQLVSVTLFPATTSRSRRQPTIRFETHSKQRSDKSEESSPYLRRSAPSSLCANLTVCAQASPCLQTQATPSDEFLPSSVAMTA